MELHQLFLTKNACYMAGYKDGAARHYDTQHGGG